MLEKYFSPFVCAVNEDTSASLTDAAMTIDFIKLKKNQEQLERKFFLSCFCTFVVVFSVAVCCVVLR